MQKGLHEVAFRIGPAHGNVMRRLEFIARMAQPPHLPARDPVVANMTGQKADEAIGEEHHHLRFLLGDRGRGAGMTDAIEIVIVAVLPHREQGLFDQLAGHLLAPAEERVAYAAIKRVGFAVKGMIGEAGRFLGKGADRDVAAVLDERLFEVVRSGEFEIDEDAGPALHEAIDGSLKPELWVGDDTVDDADPKAPGEFAAAPADAFAEGVDVGEELAHALVGDLAELGQAKTAAAAIAERAAAEFALEGGKMGAEGRLGEVQGDLRGAETAGLGEGCEDPQEPQIDVVQASHGRFPQEGNDTFTNLNVSFQILLFLSCGKCRTLPFATARRESHGNLMVGSERLALAFLALVLPSLVNAAEAKDRIRILAPTWSGFAPVFVANDLGYFERENLDVSIKFEDERPNVMSAMARGDIEVDMRSIGEYQGRPRDDETPGVIIGTIDQSLGGDGVVVDGTIHSAADLKGKAVASEPNVPGRLLLQLVLKDAGLSLADVRMKEIVTADSVSVFADTSIAAVVTFEPFLSQTIKNNPTRHPVPLVTSKQYPGIIVDTIIARQDDLASNPAKYRNLLIGIYKAIDYFHSNPEDFIRLAAPHLQLSPADFKASIDGSLVYTSYGDASAYFGTPAAPGTLYPIFDKVMALNLENGAADHHLVATKSIDSSVMATISADDLK